MKNLYSYLFYINGENSIELAYIFVRLIEQTQQAIATIEQQANIAAQDEPQIDFNQQLDIRKSGTFTWKQKTLTLNDTKRDRSFSAQLYRPQTNLSIPVVVISPGLGADGDNFAYLAQHLASHGLAAITINHPGSDRLRVENFFQGKNREIIEAQEFIDRPQDISFLLDELQRKSNNSPANSRLNLEQVGIIGHSFGGSTALALAGAKHNLQSLKSYCQTEANKPDLFNPSLVFQCLAAELSTSEDIPLSDPRIKAVFALNPMVSSIFGQSGLSQINVPVTLVAGSEDFITPALIEQIIPFTWLENADKYLLLIEKGHTYNDSENLEVYTNQSLPRYQQYFQAMSLAFMQSYLVNDRYQKFLSSSYVKSIAHQSLKLNLVDSLQDDNLEKFEY
ncbi:dienelactone hydrolase family protein [Pleurocapsales cyanobacterium LEGE 10410]|nr:dienelactone hydrolase family protein [Pleurocapsales cyanobacterium LEGE 10410]